MANNVADADGNPATKNFAGWNNADSLVLKRHDCVHRNGKTANNDDVEITSVDIASTLSGGLECSWLKSIKWSSSRPRLRIHGLRVDH